MAIKGLKRFRLQDIEPGMIIGKTVLDEFGRVILEQGKVILQEGTMLTRDLLDRLMNWNIQVIDIQVLLPASSEKPDSARQSAGDGTVAELLDWLECRENLSVNLDRLVQLLGRKYPADSVFTCVLEGNPKRWWTAASAGSFRLPDANLEQKFKGADYLAGQPVLIDELSMEKAPPPSLSRADMLSMCGVPIQVDGVTVGAIELFSRNA